ncbi:MAG: hypothetical protein IJ220_04240 [Clostridia bacterium]|nr:hypothetical protein [Clostridia bacterium]
MFWNFLILILEILSALFAFPYGRWENTQKNKSGGIIVYIISTAGIALAIAQIIV